TSESLVLMDEMGRGTSTSDGLALAWAAARHLASELRAFTLFATQYFELTQLADEMPAVLNAHLSATAHGGKIAVLHRVQEGPASRSYGLQVAQLAGVPPVVIRQARDKLAELESGASPAMVQGARQDAPASPPPRQPDMFSSGPSAAEKALMETDPDNLTPRQALELVYRLRKLV